MGLFPKSIRDFFNMFGLCQSDADLARRPVLIDAIIAHARPYLSTASSSREKRMQQFLDYATIGALEKIAAEKVIVCFDERLKEEESIFAPATVEAVYYNNGQQKILAIKDIGACMSSFNANLDFTSGSLTYKLCALLDEKAVGTYAATETLIVGQAFPLSANILQYHQVTAEEAARRPSLSTPPPIVLAPTPNRAPAPGRE